MIFLPLKNNTKTSYWYQYHVILLISILSNLYTTLVLFTLLGCMYYSNNNISNVQTMKKFVTLSRTQSLIIELSADRVNLKWILASYTNWNLHTTMWRRFLKGSDENELWEKTAYACLTATKRDSLGIIDQNR